MATAGAEIVELSLPDSFKTAHSGQRIVMNVECASFHEQFHATQADDYGPRVRSGMEMGMLVPATKYLQAQRLRRQFRQDLVQMVRQVDAVITPATPAPAPKDRNTTGDASFQVPGPPAVAGCHAALGTEPGRDAFGCAAGRAAL